MTINDKNGLTKRDTLYWPVLHNKRIGALFNELSYFTECIRKGKKPEKITPEEARTAVEVVCSAEKSAVTGKPVEI